MLRVHHAFLRLLAAFNKTSLFNKGCRLSRGFTAPASISGASVRGGWLKLASSMLH